MKRYLLLISRLALISVFLAAAISAASAETVTVRPGNMNGWYIAVYNSPDPGATQPVAQFKTDQHAMGTGAFYAETGSGNSDPAGCGMVWIGTDAFNGVRMSKITKLQYKTFTYYGGNLPTNTVKQPFALHLIVGKAGWPPQDWRYVISRPWGHPAPPGTPGDYTHFGKWETWDLVNDGHLLVDVLANNWTGTWPNYMNYYPTAYLGDTWYGWPNGDRWGIDGYAPTCGSLNFVVGANKHSANGFGEWWTESRNYRGFLDSFTIGIRQADGSIKETTYDFEPGDDVPPVVALNNLAAKDSIISKGRNNFLYTVFGKCTATDRTGTWFTINDGAGTQINVKCYGHLVQSGKFVRAQGSLDRNTNPPSLYSDEENVIIY